MEGRNRQLRSRAPNVIAYWRQSTLEKVRDDQALFFLEEVVERTLFPYGTRDELLSS
jgi:hypothetical protein